MTKQTHATDHQRRNIFNSLSSIHKSVILVGSRAAQSRSGASTRPIGSAGGLILWSQPPVIARYPEELHPDRVFHLNPAQKWLQEGLWIRNPYNFPFFRVKMASVNHKLEVV